MRRRSMIPGLAAAAGALVLFTLVASYGAQHVTSLLMRTILSPVPTPQTVTTGVWNGLPVGYKYNPYIDEEHTDDWVSESPWKSDGQYGMFMKINDATINGFGCGPNGPLDCNVGTSPSQHYARGNHFARVNGQKLLVGSWNTNPSPVNPHPQSPIGYGNQAASEHGSGSGFFTKKDSKLQKLMVGSWNTNPSPANPHPQSPQGYGNQAASEHGSGSGFFSKKDSKLQKLMVGSWNTNPSPANPHPQSPQGYGNQAASEHGSGSGFFSKKDSKLQKLMVGSYPTNPSFQNPHPSQPAGYGNEAMSSTPQGFGQSPGAFFSKKDSKVQKLMVGSFPTNPSPSNPQPQNPQGFGNQAASEHGTGSGFFSQKARKMQSLAPTNTWNGLPEGYHWDPFIENPQERTTRNPWAHEGQFGQYMGISDETINGFGCGPDGPLNCNVGTSPSQHWAMRPRQIMRNQQAVIAVPVVGID